MNKIIIIITTSFLLISCNQTSLWDNINDSIDGRLAPPPPGIITMSPLDGATEVHTNSEIEIIFDENTDSGKLIQGNFELWHQSVTKVNFSFYLTNKTVTLRPCSPHLLHGSTYSIHILNVLESDHISNFSTVANPEITPEPTITTVIGNSSISFYCNFSQPMIVDGWVIKVTEFDINDITIATNSYTDSVFTSAWMDQPNNKTLHIEIPIDLSNTKTVSISLKNFQAQPPLGGFLNGIPVVDPNPQATYDYNIP